MNWETFSGRYKARDGINCQWRIARRPVGNVRPEDFEWTEEPIPVPKDGEVLLETMYLGLAPVMRMYMMGTDRTGDEHQRVGDVIRGRGVARVIESKNPDLPVGEIVQGAIGWQTYRVSSMTPAEKFFRVTTPDLPYSLAAGALGMNGLSAFAGFFICGEPKRGDVTVISGAAGGVGTMVVQMARIAGSRTIVGIAGGAEKCRFIKDLGCDEAIDYKSESVPQRLKELCPEGIDFYFDNVGGEILTACLENLAMNARIVLCGSISEYTRETPFGLTNYTRLRAVEGKMAGFFVYNHLHRWEEFTGQMADWIRAGKIKPVQDIVEGFESMPAALSRLFEGKNVGVQCCRVRPEPVRRKLFD
ncbi:MAG: NADP-dependent oxidoreductase [Acidobacteria bacterium]|nr:NADP-dependent oxidoreductase [Acidobacteriota bacterium]